MDISDMELSPNSRSNSSSRSSTPKPEKSMTDCERRRSAMIRLHQQNTMIAGYKQYLKSPIIAKGEEAVHKEMERQLKYTMAAREKLVSELRTLPPCLVFNCPDHTTLETKNSVPKSLTENSITTEIDKKPSQKRKNTKNNSDDFVFPSKSARPTTPTKVLEPVEVHNSYDNLDEDPEINATETPDKPAPPPPQPIFLKIKDNYREQLNKIMQKFPNVKSKSSGKNIKLNTDCHFEHQEIIDFMDEDREFEFYVFKPKETKPIKVVVKGLPGCTKPNEIVSDLEDQGYTVSSVNQLISKRTKLELPFFLITMPRNEFNLTVFDLTHLGYMQVKIEGYSVRGITQRFNSNNFYHTAANCHMITRCLKCGKEHPTKECDIKERQENPYCINCDTYGHTACYTKCPNFPKPKKGSPLLNRNNKKFTSNNVVEGISFANMVSGNKNNNDPSPSNNNNKSERQSTPRVSPSNEINSSDFQDIIDLFKIVSNIFKQFPKLKEILPDLKKTKDFKQQALMLMDVFMD
ncbi:uncharacterized protein TNCV_1679501 [Trichonephila clavipes]|nr:uncharacterized protein TNCV_1679501 [Trichonephila clavipes]